MATFVFEGGTTRIVLEVSDEDVTFTPVPDAFEPCANCWQGSGCEVRGACIIDAVAEGDMVVGPALHNATLEQIAAEVEKRRTELDAWKVKVDASAAAMPSWAAPMEPVPFEPCPCGCGEPAQGDAENFPYIFNGTSYRHADEEAPESHGEAEKGVPLYDWLMGEDEPLAEAHSERVSDPDALLILNVAGVLMRKGVAIDEILLRMLTEI